LLKVSYPRLFYDVTLAAKIMQRRAKDCSMTEIKRSNSLHLKLLPRKLQFTKFFPLIEKSVVPWTV